MELKKKEKVILTQEYRGFKKGTVGYFAGYDYSSGHRVAKFAVHDKSFDDFLAKHNEFNTFDEYIKYQNKENIFGDQYWMNPFLVIKPYENMLMSSRMIELEISNAREKIEKESSKIKELGDLNKILN